MPKYERKVKRVTKLAAYEDYLRKRQTAARPNWIQASVLHRERVEWRAQCALTTGSQFTEALPVSVLLDKGA